MKKLSLFVSITAIVLFSSCDDENNPSDPYLLVPKVQEQPKFVKAQINGADFIFENTTVEKQNLTDTEGNPYTDLVVNASSPSASSTVTFRLEYMTTGPETCYYFLYKVGDNEFDVETANSFNVDVTSSTSNNIKGNFSGTLATFDGVETTFNNGSFDISF